MKPKLWIGEKEASERFDQLREKFNKSRRLANVYKIKFRGVEFEIN